MPLCTRMSIPRVYASRFPFPVSRRLRFPIATSRSISSPLGTSIRRTANTRSHRADWYSCSDSDGKIDRALEACRGQAAHLSRPPNDWEVEAQHLRFRGEVEQQLAGRQSQLRSQTVLRLGRQRAVVGDPLERLAAELGRGALEHALVEASLAKRRQQRGLTAPRQAMQQALVVERAERTRVHVAGSQGLIDQSLVHRGCTPHGVVPVDVPVHLVLREQERFERGESLLEHADDAAVGGRLVDEHERVEQTVDVDLAVRNAAHERIALEVLDLVEVERSRNEALQRRLARSADEREHSLRGAGTEHRGQHLRHRPGEYERRCHFLVMKRADLLERVREGVMADVVQESGSLRDRALLERDTRQLTALVEKRDGESGQVICAERVLEAGVRGAGVDEVRQPELPNVSEPLENGRVDELHGQRVDTDVVPQRVS